MRCQSPTTQTTLLSATGKDRLQLDARAATHIQGTNTFRTINLNQIFEIIRLHIYCVGEICIDKVSTVIAQHIAC